LKVEKERKRFNTEVAEIGAQRTQRRGRKKQEERRERLCHVRRTQEHRWEWLRYVGGLGVRNRSRGLGGRWRWRGRVRCGWRRSGGRRGFEIRGGGGIGVHRAGRRDLVWEGGWWRSWGRWGGDGWRWRLGRGGNLGAIRREGDRWGVRDGAGWK